MLFNILGKSTDSNKNHNHACIFVSLLLVFEISLCEYTQVSDVFGFILELFRQCGVSCFLFYCEVIGKTLKMNRKRLEGNVSSM
jgi:hypothetical protein